MTNLQMKNAKPGMHLDGNGLYLAVSKASARSWIFRYQLHGKRREMGIGPLHALQPIPARATAAQLKALVAIGVDPIEKRNDERLAAEAVLRKDEAALERASRTFRAAADLHIAKHYAGWRNFKHGQQ